MHLKHIPKKPIWNKLYECMHEHNECIYACVPLKKNNTHTEKLTAIQAQIKFRYYMALFSI